MTDFYSYLSQQDDAAWSRTVTELQSSIHPVDRNATRIWFAFFPIKLWRALTEAEDMEAQAKKLILKGNYLLRDQVDSSAEFLYRHRSWPRVKSAVSEYANTASPDGPLPDHIRNVARAVADEIRTDPSVLIGITAVAFGTLEQIGPEIFKQAPVLAAPGRYGKGWNKSPDQIVADRAKDDSQGLFGFLKTVDKEFSVNFREYESGCKFKVIDTQDLTMAAAQDKRDHHLRDGRCMAGEGPIPVECRTASFATRSAGGPSP